MFTLYIIFKVETIHTVSTCTCSLIMPVRSLVLNFEIIDVQNEISLISALILYIQLEYYYKD